MLFTSKFSSAILASMIKIIAPGQSAYSQVPIPICDEECQNTPLCDNEFHWKCKPPRFSQELYEQYLTEFTEQGLSGEEAMIEARVRSYTRPETYEEGLVRYAIIAEAIAHVSEGSTRHICKSVCDESEEFSRRECEIHGQDSEWLQSCQDTVDDLVKQCNENCLTSAPWRSTRQELIYMMLIAIGEEAGFRADVHGGTGERGLGDCQWELNGRHVKAWTKGARPIKSTCTSFCLGQKKVGRGIVQPYGWRGEDLLGVDMPSTERCLTSVARDLSLSRNHCLRMKGLNNDIAKLTFAAYGSGSACVLRQRKVVKVDGNRQTHYAYRVKNKNDELAIEFGLVPPDNAISKTPLEIPWPAQRAETFRMHFEHPMKLSQKDVDRLNDPRLIEAFKTLRDSPKQRFWMVPIANR